MPLQMNDAICGVQVYKRAEGLMPGECCFAARRLFKDESAFISARKRIKTVGVATLSPHLRDPLTLVKSGTQVTALEDLAAG